MYAEICGLENLLAAWKSHRERLGQIFQYHLVTRPRREGKPPAYCSRPESTTCRAYCAISRVRNSGVQGLLRLRALAVQPSCVSAHPGQAHGWLAALHVAKSFLPSSQRKNIGRQVAPGTGFWTAGLQERRRGLRSLNDTERSTGPRTTPSAWRPESGGEV